MAAEVAESKLAEWVDWHPYPRESSHRWVVPVYTLLVSVFSYHMVRMNGGGEIYQKRTGPRAGQVVARPRCTRLIVSPIPSLGV